MLLRLAELVFFGLLPFLAGSITASGYEFPEDDAVVETGAPDEAERRGSAVLSIETEGEKTIGGSAT